MGMSILGSALYEASPPEEVLPVLEANLALFRRYWPHEQSILDVQTNLAGCLDNFGRYDEALVLMRGIHARKAAMFGVSHEDTIGSGLNVSHLMRQLRLWDQAKSFVRDLLPAARRSLGPDSNITLNLNVSLALALKSDPKRTRDGQSLNRRGVDETLFSSQHRRRPARSRGHHEGRGPAATAGFRPRASGHAFRRARFVRRALGTRGRVD